MCPYFFLLSLRKFPNTISMKTKLLALLLLIPFLSIGQQYKLVSATEDNITIDIQVGMFQTYTVTTPQGEAFVVNAPKAMKHAEAGEPDLPMLVIPTIIGDDALMEVHVNALEYTDYPNMEIVTYSPPYKPEFTEEDNLSMIQAINSANPDLLWIGMTAPKQEKWAFSHWDELDIHCHCGTIGAVFDFYAGTAKRAPLWWQRHSLEWLFRLIMEPRRMWRRYVVGNTKFLCYIMKEKMERDEK